MFTREDPACMDSACYDMNEPFKQQDNGDGINCQELDLFGFTRQGDFGASQSSHSFPMSIVAGNQLTTFICPYVNSGGLRKYMSSAVEVHGIGSYGNSTTGNFSLTGNPTPNQSECAAYSVNSPSSVNVNTVVNLDDAVGGGVFYSDAGCTNVISQVTIPYLTTTSPFYYSNSSSGGINLYATLFSGDSYGPANLNITVGAAGTFSLTGPASLAQNICTIYNVATPSLVTTNTVVALDDGVLSGVFYVSADILCSGAPITQITIGAGTSSNSFRYLNSNIDSGVLTTSFVSGESHFDGTLAVAVTAGASFSITGPPNPVEYGCVPYFVNTPGTVSAITTVDLDDGAIGGTFFSDSFCGSPTTQATIPNGNSMGTFYYQINSVTSGNLNANFSSGHFHNIGSLGITVSLAPNFAINGPPNPVEYGCVPYSVDTPGVVNAITIVDLDDGAIGGTFFSDSFCGSPTTQATIPNGNSMGTFYYQINSVTSGNLNANFSSGHFHNIGSHGITVNSAPNFAITGPATITATICSTYTVDTPGPVNMATDIFLDDSGGGGAFHSAPGCGSPIGQITIPMSGMSQTFYYVNPSSGSPILNATFSNGEFYNPGNLPLTVDP